MLSVSVIIIIIISISIIITVSLKRRDTEDEAPLWAPPEMTPVDDPEDVVWHKAKPYEVDMARMEAIVQGMNTPAKREWLIRQQERVMAERERDIREFCHKMKVYSVFRFQATEESAIEADREWAEARAILKLCKNT